MWRPTVQSRRALAQEIGPAQLTLETVMVGSFHSPHVRLNVDTRDAHVGAQHGSQSVQGWLTHTAPLLGRVQDSGGQPI